MKSEFGEGHRQTLLLWWTANLVPNELEVRKPLSLSLSHSPLIWDRLRRDSGLETASQSSPPPRLPAMRRVCGLESLRIFLGFRNQRLRSQIQTSPMELPGPDLEDLKISWKTPKQVRPYERPSTKQWHGALSPRGPDSPADVDAGLDAH